MTLRHRAKVIPVAAILLVVGEILATLFILHVLAILAGLIFLGDA